MSGRRRCRRRRPAGIDGEGCGDACEPMRRTTKAFSDVIGCWRRQAVMPRVFCACRCYPGPENLLGVEPAHNWLPRRRRRAGAAVRRKLLSLAASGAQPHRHDHAWADVEPSVTCPEQHRAIDPIGLARARAAGGPPQPGWERDHCASRSVSSAWASAVGKCGVDRRGQVSDEPTRCRSALPACLGHMR